MNRPPRSGRMAGAAGPKKRFTDSAALNNRMTPYSTPSTLKKLNPNAPISAEEVEALVQLDQMHAKLVEEDAAVEAETKEARKRHRDALDNVKIEIRGPKKNGEQIQAVKETAARLIEETKVKVLGEIADDKALWEERKEDPAMERRGEELKAKLGEVRETYDASKKVFEHENALREKVEAEVGSVQEQMREAEAQIHALETESASIDIKLETLASEAQVAKEAADRSIKEASAILSKKQTTDSELATADEQRSRMEARVNRLSNNIKAFCHLPAAAPKAVAPGAPDGGKVTALKVTSDDKPLTFDLDLVSSSDSFGPTAAQILPASMTGSRSLVIVTPAVSSLSPVYVGDVLRSISARLTGETQISAVEVFGEQPRDLLKARDHQEQAITGDATAAYEVDGTVLKGVEAKGGDGVAQEVEDNVQLRAERGAIRTPVTVIAQVKSDARTVHVVFTASAPGKTAGSDNQPHTAPHIITCLTRMTSDAKEAKALFRKSVAGTYVSNLLYDSCPTTVVGIVTDTSTPITVTDTCRALHRIRLVDLGVKA